MAETGTDIALSDFFAARDAYEATARALLPFVDGYTLRKRAPELADRIDALLWRANGLSIDAPGHIAKYASKAQGPATWARVAASLRAATKKAAKLLAEAETAATGWTCEPANLRS